MKAPASTPRLSVVMPMRNAAPTLERCLTALESQLRARDELIVVDNNSVDASRAIARRHAGVRLLAASRQGAYVARNVGCRVATGEIVAFLDPDCEPCPGWRDAIVGAFQDSAVGLVVGPRTFGLDTTALALAARYENVKTAWVYGQTDPTLYFGYTNNMAVRRDVWRAVGPFVERRRGADTIFVRRVVDRFSPGVACYHPVMQVRHLEVDRLRVYLRKMRIYGRSRRLYRTLAPVRSLTGRERLGVLRRALQSGPHRLRSAALLGSLLSLGLCAWTVGSLTARWSAWERRRPAPGGQRPAALRSARGRGSS